jgi:iron complex transport system ATP-binding protein
VTELRIQNVSVRFGKRTPLHPLTTELKGGELLGLIGPNGAGKSTLLKAIAQLLPHSGQCRLDDASLERLSARERSRCLAYLAQADQLQWPISVRDLVALGRHPFRGSWWRGAGRPSAEDESAIEAALRAADVDTLRDRRIDTLSRRRAGPRTPGAGTCRAGAATAGGRTGGRARPASSARRHGSAA